MKRNNLIPFRPKRNRSGAVVPTEYEPRIKADSSATYQYAGAKMFTLSASTSKVITPEQMSRMGMVMIHLGAPSTSGNNAIGAKTIVPEKQIGPFKEKGQQLIYSWMVRDEWREDILANFVVEPVEIITKVGPDGAEDFLKFVITSPDVKREGTISMRDYISKMSKEVRARWPEFRLYDIGKNAEKAFQEYLSRIYAAVSDKLPHRTVYRFAGWNDANHYLSGADSDCESERVLPDVSNVSVAALYQTWIGRILSLGREPNLSVVLVLQFHADVLQKPFSDAGSPIQHMANYVGPTGSRKTATAKVLNGSFFNVNTVVNFTATDAGINLLVKSRCRDSTLVLDNLSNALDKSMVRTLNQFLLQFGDSEGRVKTANGGTELVQNDVRCAVVVTSESQLECLQLSNRLRMLSVPLTKDSIDNTVLAVFQWDRQTSKRKKCASGLDQYKASFINYVETHYDEIAEFVTFFQPPEMPLRFARQARTYRNLVAIATIILRFGENCGALSTGEGTEILEKEWLPAIQAVMRYNELLCYSEEPVKLFLRAIASGVAQKIFPVAPNKEAFQLNPSQLAGYWDGQVLRIDPNRAYTYVANTYRVKGFAATASDIWTTLRDRGISEGYHDKNKKVASLFKILTLNGVKLDMLCLKWSEVEKVLSEEEG